MHGCRYVIVVMASITITEGLLTQSELKATACDGMAETLTAGYTAHKIYSPGYPDLYRNNLDCEWVIEAPRNRKQGYGIQIATLDIELEVSNTTNIGNCLDYLEAFEGFSSSQNRSLSKWCGRTLKVIKSTAASITLKFSTNNLQSGRGFVIEYAYIRLECTKCLPGTAPIIQVGQVPLYETFYIKTAESSFMWNVEAVDDDGNEDPRSALVIEAFDLTSIPCDEGKFVVYDGNTTRDSRVLEWCHTTQPFSKIYLSSHHGTVAFVFMERAVLDTNIGSIQLKLFSRYIQHDCHDSDIDIDVGFDPLFFTLPFYVSLSGEPCHVLVSQNVRDSLRLEVMSVDGHKIDCDVDAVQVIRASTDTKVEKSGCSPDGKPMYLPFESDVIVSPRISDRKVYLRAISSDYICDGREITGQAYDSFITEKVLPRDSDIDNIQNNCYSKFVITTNEENQVISVSIQWKYSSQATYSEPGLCLGDYIKVFDGSNETAPLLFSSCNTTDLLEGFLNTRVIGTKAQMFLLFITDESDNAKHVNVEFFSVPANTVLCQKMMDVHVDRTLQNLTSINYPWSYPLGITCTYKLTTNESDVIVVEIVDAEFVPGCGDIINIYQGGSQPLQDNLVGNVCGGDPVGKRFVSAGHTMVIEFLSNKFGPNQGGWKLAIFSETRRPPHRADPNSGFTAIPYFIVVFSIGIGLCSILHYVT